MTVEEIKTLKACAEKALLQAGDDLDEIVEKLIKMQKQIETGLEITAIVGHYIHPADHSRLTISFDRYYQRIDEIKADLAKLLDPDLDLDQNDA